MALRFDWKFAVPVLIALMHDLLITAGVYALTGREVTVDTVAALLTILGYSLYDTIIVFDRVRENIPRMPRAAFSQIVNRSMAEVLTRSLATTSCTLLPIIALLLFGGSTLQDFAFALLIGVASGAYSSIFIASPVLTHWKEREPTYRHRRHRIESEYGFVAPFATAAADVEPARERVRRRAGRLTEPAPDGVSAAEFEQMKRDIAEEEAETARRTSTLTKRLAHTPDSDEPPSGRAARTGNGGRTGARPSGGGRPAAKRGRPAAKGGRSTTTGPQAPADRAPAPGDGGQTPDGAQTPDRAQTPDGAQRSGGAPAPPPGAPAGPGPVSPPEAAPPAEDQPFERAPDIAENEGVAPVNKPPRGAKPRSRNRRHGRRR